MRFWKCSPSSLAHATGRFLPKHHTRMFTGSTNHKSFRLLLLEPALSQGLYAEVQECDRGVAMMAQNVLELPVSAEGCLSQPGKSRHDCQLGDAVRLLRLSPVKCVKPSGRQHLVARPAAPSFKALAYAWRPCFPSLRLQTLPEGQTMSQQKGHRYCYLRRRLAASCILSRKAEKNCRTTRQLFLHTLNSLTMEWLTAQHLLAECSSWDLSGFEFGCS